MIIPVLTIWDGGVFEGTDILGRVTWLSIWSKSIDRLHLAEVVQSLMSSSSEIISSGLLVKPWI